VDENSLGVVDYESLAKYYTKIIKVGEHDDLPFGRTDAKLLSFLIKYDADLITLDNRAYTHFLDNGVKTVEITEFRKEVKSKQICYLVKIIKIED